MAVSSSQKASTDKVCQVADLFVTLVKGRGGALCLRHAELFTLQGSVWEKVSLSFPALRHLRGDAPMQEAEGPLESTQSTDTVSTLAPALRTMQHLSL